MMPLDKILEEQRRCLKEMNENPDSYAWLGVQDWIKEEILLYGDIYLKGNKNDIK